MLAAELQSQVLLGSCWLDNKADTCSDACPGPLWSTFALGWGFWIENGVGPPPPFPLTSCHDPPPLVLLVPVLRCWLASSSTVLGALVALAFLVSFGGLSALVALRLALLRLIATQCL